MCIRDRCSSKYFFTFACKEVDTFTVILFPFFFLLFTFSPAIKYLFYLFILFSPFIFLRNLTFYLLAAFLIYLFTFLFLSISSFRFFKLKAHSFFFTVYFLSLFSIFWEFNSLIYGKIPFSIYVFSLSFFLSFKYKNTLVLPGCFGDISFLSPIYGADDRTWSN